MKFPKKLRYTREHEWVLIEANQATIGITDFAQHELGEVVYVELPKIGDAVTKDETFGVVESVKAASDIYAPVSGEVTEVNEDLTETPEMLNDDPYGDAWLIRVEMSDPAEMEQLMTADDYKAYVEEEAEIENGEDEEEEEEDLDEDDDEEDEEGDDEDEEE
jgi:glycine cleavage system H protein